MHALQNQYLSIHLSKWMKWLLLIDRNRRVYNFYWMKSETSKTMLKIDFVWMAWLANIANIISSNQGNQFFNFIMRTQLRAECAHTIRSVYLNGSFLIKINWEASRRRHTDKENLYYIVHWLRPPRSAGTQSWNCHIFVSVYVWPNQFEYYERLLKSIN